MTEFDETPSDGRDPTVDHHDELYPKLTVPEDLSDVIDPDSGEQKLGDNVVDGVAHFLLITSDGDQCGGCGADWPCKHRVPLEVQANPTIDPALVEAVAEALAARKQ